MQLFIGHLLHQKDVLHGIVHGVLQHVYVLQLTIHNIKQLPINILTTACQVIYNSTTQEMK